MASSADFYYQVYNNQRGGEFPVFRGARYVQYGSGFGDIFRGIFRHILPIVVQGASSFFGNLMQSREKGATWGQAAKSSIAPTAHSVLTEAANQIQPKQDSAEGESQKQAGSGKRKKKKRAGQRILYKGNDFEGKKRKISLDDFIAKKIPKYNF